jgi:hypothetical protein
MLFHSSMLYLLQSDQRVSKDYELLVRENHYFEQIMLIFHFMNASMSQNDRANSELCQINKHRMIKGIRMAINMLSEAKTLRLQTPVKSLVLPLSTFRERILIILSFLKVCFQFYCCGVGSSKSSETFQRFSPDPEAKIMRPSKFPFRMNLQKTESSRKGKAAKRGPFLGRD